MPKNQANQYDLLKQYENGYKLIINKYQQMLLLNLSDKNKLTEDIQNLLDLIPNNISVIKPKNNNQDVYIKLAQKQWIINRKEDKNYRYCIPSNMIPLMQCQQLKSQTFCTKILYFIIIGIIQPYLNIVAFYQESESITKPLLSLLINSIIKQNIFVGHTNKLCLVLCPSSAKKYKFTQITPVIQSKDYLREVGLMFRDLLQPKLQSQKTFLWIIIHSLINRQLSIRECDQILTDKRSRKKFVSNHRHKNQLYYNNTDSSYRVRSQPGKIMGTLNMGNSNRKYSTGETIETRKFGTKNLRVFRESRLKLRKKNTMSEKSSLCYQNSEGFEKISQIRKKDNFIIDRNLQNYDIVSVLKLQTQKNRKNSIQIHNTSNIIHHKKHSQKSNLTNRHKIQTKLKSSDADLKIRQILARKYHKEKQMRNWQKQYNNNITNQDRTLCQQYCKMHTEQNYKQQSILKQQIKEYIQTQIEKIKNKNITNVQVQTQNTAQNNQSSINQYKKQNIKNIRKNLYEASLQKHQKRQQKKQRKFKNSFNCNQDFGGIVNNKKQDRIIKINNNVIKNVIDSSLDDIQQISLIQTKNNIRNKKQDYKINQIQQKNSKQKQIIQPNKQDQLNYAVSQLQIKVMEYIQMINVMGQAVSRSANLANKLKKIDWFPGVYYLYKRFQFQRIKIQQTLLSKVPGCIRSYYTKKIQDNLWQQWYNTEKYTKLRANILNENKQIKQSLLKMEKKLLKKYCKVQRIKKYSSPNKFVSVQSELTIQCVVKQFDALDDKNMLNDSQIMIHISEMIQALLVIVELDKKQNIVKQTPTQSIGQYLRRKLSLKEIQEIADKIYKLYGG